MERNFDNTKDVIYVVTEMEDSMGIFEEKNMPKYLYEGEEKYTPKKKILELELKRYMDIE